MKLKLLVVFLFIGFTVNLFSQNKNVAGLYSSSIIALKLNPDSTFNYLDYSLVDIKGSWGIRNNKIVCMFENALPYFLMNKYMIFEFVDSMIIKPEVSFKDFRKDYFLNLPEFYKTHGLNKNGDISYTTSFKYTKNLGLIKDGEWVYFSKKDEVSAIVNYKNNKLHGKSIYFYTNQKLKNNEFYKNGLKQGVWKFYSEDGFLLRKEYYKNNKLVKVERYDI